MRTILLSLTLLPSLAFAQSAPQPTPTAARPKKVPTPRQVTDQAQKKTEAAQIVDPRAAANAAYTAEIARERVGTCPNVTTTYDINMCLAHEAEITQANYKAFTTALRAMLAPTTPDDTPFDGGPTGPAATSAAKAAAFDAAESAWQTYATAECNAVDTFWRGGTIVNSMVGYCYLRLTRARLHELNDAYDMPLHH